MYGSPTIYDYFGIKISPTKIYPTTQGKIYLPNMSEIVSDSTFIGYKLHTVITSFTGDENVQVNFKYIDNLIYPAIAGRCYIFPSWLMHSVQMNRSSEDRISMSFNIFFDKF